MSKQIQKEYIVNNGTIKCMLCECGIEDHEMIEIMGREKKEQLDDKLIQKQYNIVKCVKCGN